MAEENDTNDAGITAEVRLSGMQKTAILFLALDKDHSKKLLENMDEMEIRDLTQAMTSLGSIDSDTVEKVLLEFTGSLTGTRLPPK